MDAAACDPYRSLVGRLPFPNQVLNLQYGYAVRVSTGEMDVAYSYDYVDNAPAPIAQQVTRRIVGHFTLDKDCSTVATFGVTVNPFSEQK